MLSFTEFKYFEMVQNALSDECCLNVYVITIENIYCILNELDVEFSVIHNYLYNLHFIKHCIFFVNVGYEFLIKMLKGALLFFLVYNNLVFFI